MEQAAITHGYLAGVEAGDIEIKYDSGPNDPRTYSALPSCPAEVSLGDRVLVKITVQYEPMLPSGKFYVG